MCTLSYTRHRCSGGRRIDLEILQRAVALWFTDYSFRVPANHCPEPDVDSLVSQNDWSGQQVIIHSIVLFYMIVYLQHALQRVP